MRVVDCPTGAYTGKHRDFAALELSGPRENHGFREAEVIKVMSRFGTPVREDIK